MRRTILTTSDATAVAGLLSSRASVAGWGRSGCSCPPDRRYAGVAIPSVQISNEARKKVWFLDNEPVSGSGHDRQFCFGKRVIQAHQVIKPDLIIIADHDKHRDHDVAEASDREVGLVPVQLGGFADGDRPVSGAVG